MKIAQEFTPGFVAQMARSPGGTADIVFSRPFGTASVMHASPPLKWRAIFSASLAGRPYRPVTPHPAIPETRTETVYYGPVNARLKRWGLLALGWGFILVGIAGLFLPVLQGILCLLIGLFILSSEYVWAHKLLGKLKARFPKIAAQFEKAKEKSEAWISRTLHRERNRP